MSDRPYKPGPSKIHGLGVIATRLIHAGERILFGLGPEYRGFNHSCAPNLGRLYHRSRLYEPYRFSLVDIPEGSELTLSYTGRLEFICNCPKCRKENER